MVKELRQKTGAGIGMCKEALVASDGNQEEAELYIRKKDKDKAAKKSERATGEGVVFAETSDDLSLGAVVEIACETDFVAKNQSFQDLGSEMLAAVAAAGTIDNLDNIPTPSGKTAGERMQEAVATIGENMKLRRIAILKAPENGCIGQYRHFNQKAASLVALKLDGADPKSDAVQGLLRDICMHITSCRPLGLSKEDIPEEVLAKEKAVYMEEVANKPEDIQEKILQGKLGKFFATNCLNEQGFVKDDKVKVKDHVAQTLKAAGGSGELVGFVRFELGGTASGAAAKIVESQE